MSKKGAALVGWAALGEGGAAQHVQDAGLEMGLLYATNPNATDSEKQAILDKHGVTSPEWSAALATLKSFAKKHF